MRAGWLWIALATAAQACVPSVNSQGEVRCGDSGICPRNFTCSFGHCCPVGSDAAVCPAATYVDRINDGGLRCNSRGECPNAHGYVCRQGITCCPQGTDGTGACSPGAPGVACNAATQCDPIQTANGVAPSACMTETALKIGGLGFLGDAVRVQAPNGYCTASCKAEDFRSCGATGYCLAGLRIPGAPAEFDGICAARCSNPTGGSYTPCRVDQSSGGTQTGYSCFPLAPGSGSPEGYCFPDCTRNDYCVELNSRYRLLLGTNQLVCNPSTRVCEVPPMGARDR